MQTIRPFTRLRLMLTPVFGAGIAMRQNPRRPEATRRMGRPRTGERGATLFVVLTVMTLLTAVGVYAARAASLVDRAAGFDRQFLQTQYLAAYGTQALAAELGTGSATTRIVRMSQAPESCRVTRGIQAPPGGGTPPCLSLAMSEIASRVDALTGQELLEPYNAVAKIPGSLGTTPTTGNFAIELSEPGPAARPVAGTDVGGTGPGFQYLRVTATTLGQVSPQANADTCDAGASAVAGLQTMRAYIELGPVATQ